MNFYKRYTGDYGRDTATLSMLEHGAYNLMLDAFYGGEGEPLPVGKDLYRLIRCETSADKKAVDKVTKKYWKHVDGGIINQRALEEIEKAKKIAERNKTNGKRGGRPKQSQTEPSENPVGYFSDTQTEPSENPCVKQHQIPDTRYQTKDIPTQESNGSFSVVNISTGEVDFGPMGGKF